MATESEASLEKKLIQKLQDGGYEFVDIQDEEGLINNFKIELGKYNNTTFSDTEFNKIMLYLEGDSVFKKSKKLRGRYRLERDDGETKFITFLNDKEWCKNQFQVAHQITLQGKYKNRYDVTILINGLPLVQIELKKSGVELKKAFNQIERYQRHSYHNLFNYIQIFIISNGVDTKYFANNRSLSYKFTFTWKDEKNKNINYLNEFAETFLEKCHLSKMIARYMVLNESTESLMVLRAYQYYAVEAILNQALNTNNNGYIWHTTGSGKTLTSFKACQILQQEETIDKVMFVVDRQDLDNQTTSEFNHFCEDAVSGTDNTKSLIKQLKGENKLIITTIQKLNNAVKHHDKHLNSLKDKKMILMFDECHRSQFGEMHKNITDYFNNIQCFGFTGTPIFAENALEAQKTTKSIFGKKLHQYLIQNAIHDDNVLGFSVEYLGKFLNIAKFDEEVQNIDTKKIYENPKRIDKIVDYIIANHDAKTFDREFNAIFAVQNIKAVNDYYDAFKIKNHDLKIATINTFGANDDIEEGEKHPRDKLENHIQDFNEMFGTNFSTNNFGDYYVNVSKYMKQNQIDILLVSDMFLTGFDSKLLNTLYVDKNLRYHGLLQAYSRTNRVINEKKKQGNIVCFRNLKEETDKAIRLFSDENAIEDVIMPPYKHYVVVFKNLVVQLKDLVPNVQDVDELPDENELKKFILIYREMLRNMVKMRAYNEFNFDDLGITEQDFEDYKSKYLDQIIDEEGTEKTSVLDDIDFELELIRRDTINVAYILSLLNELDPTSSSFEKDREHIINTMNTSVELRSKIELINNFIETTIIPQGKAQNIEEPFEEYIDKEKTKEVENLVKQEDLDKEKTNEIISEYEFTGKMDNDLIKQSINEELTFLARRHKVQEIKDKIISLIIKYTM